MKMTEYSAALAALYTKDPSGWDRSFQHLTPPVLAALDSQLQLTNDNGIISHDHSQVLAKAVIRRIVHKCLDKYTRISSSEIVEEALKYHVLPEQLQLELKERYGHEHIARTWFDSLQHLKRQTSNKSELWKELLDHPMTAYVPMQCQSCGHIIPDNSDDDDKKVGLSEEEPTGDELELRSGWFRGPRRAVIFVIKECPKCRSYSRWYRSGHPKIMLNPNRWGRLCGEQEDLRLNLAAYLGIPLRICLPLDWDHVWTEFRGDDEDDDSNNNNNNNRWQLPDANARNFAVRLDEGIGSWAGVWAIHPDPTLCEDATDDYLRCYKEGGHADDSNSDSMERYRQLVQSARHYDDGAVATQAKSINGFVLQRANFTTSKITKEIQQAAKDYGAHPWWEVK